MLYKFERDSTWSAGRYWVVLAESEAAALAVLQQHLLETRHPHALRWARATLDRLPGDYVLRRLQGQVLEGELV